MVEPAVHDLSDDSIRNDINIQDAPESADEDVLLLEASQELFSATTAEPLVVTLGDAEEFIRVVELSDDDMSERVGGQGLGYVRLDSGNQSQPPPTTNGFPGHDLRLRIDQLGMDRNREELSPRDPPPLQGHRGEH